MTGCYLKNQVVQLVSRIRLILSQSRRHLLVLWLATGKQQQQNKHELNASRALPPPRLTSGGKQSPEAQRSALTQHGRTRELPRELPVSPGCSPQPALGTALPSGLPAALQKETIQQHREPYA